MTPTGSSAIPNLGYNPDSRTARLQFASGRIHDYPNVEPEEYEALRSADSIGRHFNAVFNPRSTPREHRRIE